MNSSIRFLIALCLIWPGVSQAQVSVNVSETVRLTFPGPPEIIDTLGQKVYHFSDETGYYACIAQKTNLNATKRAALDINQFYNQVYESLAIPGDHCKQVRQQPIVIHDLAGIEFYATCDQHPETPELRYKRLLLYESMLFVLDFWTTQSYFSKATANKNAFFESMTLLAKDDAALIPSAFEPTESKDRISYNWLILVLVLVPVIYFLSKRKPKK